MVIKARKAGLNGSNDESDIKDGDLLEADHIIPQSKGSKNN
jgi:hypothetical protein